MNTRGSSLVGLIALVAALGACNNPKADARLTGSEAVESTAQEIINGTPASAYPEAVTIDIQQGGQTVMGCSGSVIAPKVVLTAAHCVADGDGWNIKAPYANGQTAHGSSSATFDWTQTNDQVSPDENDIGLVFLDSPITLTTYPTISSAKLPDQSDAVTVGRVKNGQLSKTALYVSPTFKVKDASNFYNFKNDYQAPMSIEHGDSGGPTYSGSSHTIIAVNSSGDDTTMLLARVDTVAKWIADNIAAHGGGGSTDPGQGGSDPGQGGSDPGQGGSDPGQGGSDPGQGGSDPGQGGSDPGQGGSDPGEGGSDPGGCPGGQWPHGPGCGPNGPGGGPGGPGNGPGGPGGPGQHCVFIPWMWSWYCW
ncbi:Flagelliform silk protein [Minicystis rosea]|nr:Flagelliform silk protein [Minicystis rosea]